MKNQTHKRAALIALLFGVLTLSGCGARKTARSGAGAFDSASRSVLDQGIFCNSFSSTATKLDGRIQTYMHIDGVHHDDDMHVRITGLTSSFDANSNYKIKFYRGKETNDSSTPFYVDPEPVSFVLINGNKNLVSGEMTEIKKSNITQIRSNFGISGSTSSDFFNQVDFLIADVDYEWDVLIVSIRDESGTTPVIVGEAKMLMPAFSADPDLYASEHKPELAVMHPFWSVRGSGQDFAALGDAYCF